MAPQPSRKPTRLTEYDYSTPGAYFVTVCTQDRKCILSDIIALDEPRVKLTGYGAIVEQTLLEIDRAYDHISIDNYVIMPNHIHLLVSVTERGTSRTPSPTNTSGSANKTVGAGVPDSPPSPANAVLPMLISTFKRFTNKRCGVPLWQRSYHEHVIRGQRDYEETWAYIDSNPAKWALDRYYEA